MQHFINYLYDTAKAMNTNTATKYRHEGLLRCLGDCSREELLEDLQTASRACDTEILERIIGELNWRFSGWQAGYYERNLN